jgi:hypothetical protein
MESKFILNHLFTQLKVVTILVRKSFELGLFLVSLTHNNMGKVLSSTVLGRSLA